MKTNFENEVTLTLRVSNDTEKRKAIHKVSDKMISISTYMNTGKDQSGEYNPPLNFEVNVFTKSAKTPTNMVDNLQPKAGDYITVKGTLGSRGSMSGGKKYTNMVIQAKEISAPKVTDGEDTVSENIWND